MLPILGKTFEGQWHPGIGDPSIGGWLTVAAYIITALLCIRAARRTAPRTDAHRMQWFWLVAAATLFLLAINKQLDLQTWFTEVGRRTALAEGWYDQRAIVQQAFIAGISIFGLLAVLVAAVFLRAHLAEIWLALAGGSFLIVFVIVRAMSFHHVDQFLGLTFANLPLNWLVELGGILSIAAAAFGVGAPRKASD